MNCTSYTKHENTKLEIFYACLYVCLSCNNTGGDVNYHGLPKAANLIANSLNASELILASPSTLVLSRCGFPHLIATFCICKTKSRKALFSLLLNDEEDIPSISKLVPKKISKTFFLRGNSSSAAGVFKGAMKHIYWLIEREDQESEETFFGTYRH